MRQTTPQREKNPAPRRKAVEFPLEEKTKEPPINPKNLKRALLGFCASPGAGAYKSWHELGLALEKVGYKLDRANAVQSVREYVDRLGGKPLTYNGRELGIKLAPERGEHSYLVTLAWADKEKKK